MPWVEFVKEISKIPKCAALNFTSFCELERFLKDFKRGRTSDREEGFKELFIFGNSACFKSKRERDRVVCERWCSIGSKKNPTGEVEKESVSSQSYRLQLVRHPVRKHFLVKTTHSITEVIERIRHSKEVGGWVACKGFKSYQKSSIGLSRRRWHSNTILLRNIGKSDPTDWLKIRREPQKLVKKFWDWHFVFLGHGKTLAVKVIWDKSRVLINKRLPCIERLRCLWLSAIPLIIPVKRDQFCFKVEKIKEYRMPSIFASFGYLASSNCFLISSQRCLLSEKNCVFLLLICRLELEENSWMSCRAGLTSHGSVRRSMVSSAYCCNSINAQEKGFW